MKVMQVEIKDFRHLEYRQLNFTDSVGRARNPIVLVGPNASGKTTVLDALAVSLGSMTGLPGTRPDFVLDPRSIVRRGALQAQVKCRVHFSPEEVEATRELYRLAEEQVEIPSDTEHVIVTWQYPDLMGNSAEGTVHCEPGSARYLFQGRDKTERLLNTGRGDWTWFERVGNVFTFDQQRTGMGMILPPDIGDIISRRSTIRPTFREFIQEQETGRQYTENPHKILLALAIQSSFPPVKEGQFDPFKYIQERYAEVCAPRRIEGAVRDALGRLDLVFSDGTYEYRYDGLSSGEQMLLLFLIRMVTEHIHRSIVLVDEIELHQHPLWQRKLLYLLPRIGRNNQIIATTHSAYLRDALPREAVIDLGELGDAR